MVQPISSLHTKVAIFEYNISKSTNSTDKSFLANVATRKSARPPLPTIREFRNTGTASPTTSISKKSNTRTEPQGAEGKPEEGGAGVRPTCYNGDGSARSLMTESTASLTNASEDSTTKMIASCLMDRVSFFEKPYTGRPTIISIFDQDCNNEDMSQHDHDDEYLHASFRPGRISCSSFGDYSYSDSDKKDEPFNGFSLRPGMLRGSSFEDSACDSDDSHNDDDKNASSFSLRPSMVRGHSFGDSDSDHDDSDVDDDDEQSPGFPLRPGMTRGRSFEDNDSNRAKSHNDDESFRYSLRPGMFR